MFTQENDLKKKLLFYKVLEFIDRKPYQLFCRSHHYYLLFRFAFEVFQKITPMLGELSTNLENITWAKSLSFDDGRLVSIMYFFVLTYL